MIGQAISLTFAILGAAAVYGTDVFFCVVGPPWLTSAMRLSSRRWGAFTR
jgi:hypothetical protein